MPDFSKGRPGDALTGKLTRAVYSGYREIFPAASPVRLVLAKTERRAKKAQPDDRPFAIRLFAPRHEFYPYFRSASVVLPDGSEVPIQASILRMARTVEIRTGSGKSAYSKQASVRGSDRVLILDAEPAYSALPAIAAAPASGSPRIPPQAADAGTLAGGAHARVILMQDLSASKNQRGDRFQVRLAEPLREGSRMVFPAGSVLEGLVTKRIPPRRLSRPGSLALSFTRLNSPGAAPLPVSASLASIEVAKGSHLKMDSEAALHGGSPGIARLLLETGITAGIAKATDDSVQLIMQLVISGATDASTAGTARIVAACVSGLFLLTRHGHDVVLPKYSQMEVVLNRDVPLAPRQTER